ncbi:unnamed protein product, partial [Rotaria magnacalcarata]
SVINDIAVNLDESRFDVDICTVRELEEESDDEERDTLVDDVSDEEEREEVDEESDDESRVDVVLQL